MASVAIAAALAVAPVGAGAPPPADVPTDAVFANDLGDAIAGDGGVYSNGVDCVRSFYQARKGNYLLRTVSGQIVCPDDPDGWAGRYVTLDFSNPAGAGPASCTIDGLYGDSIDACGLNTIKDVRLFADAMFSGSATPLTLFFDPEPNPGDHSVQFSLQFLADVPVGDLGGGTRSISDGGVTARLSVLAQQGKRTRYVPVADYHMPFALIVSPQ